MIQELIKSDYRNQGIQMPKSESNRDGQDEQDEKKGERGEKGKGVNGKKNP
jgi:hypothetical protein